MTTTHELKTWPPYYDAIVEGKKKFEYRKNDRDFKLGDMLLLQEWNPDRREYTGEQILAEVTYILYGPDWGLPADMCIMSIQI